MIIDSSVLIAILESEPEAEQLAEAIEQDHLASESQNCSVAKINSYNIRC